MILLFSQNYTVYYINTIETLKDMKTVFEQLIIHNKKIKHLIIQSHGSENAIYLGHKEGKKT